jgi:hypothetical protein
LIFPPWSWIIERRWNFSKRFASKRRFQCGFMVDIQGGFMVASWWIFRVASGLASGWLQGGFRVASGWIFRVDIQGGFRVDIHGGYSGWLQGGFRVASGVGEVPGVGRAEGHAICRTSPLGASLAKKPGRGVCAEGAAPLPG